jgi:ATP-binding cassette, subfamily B, bacterial
MSRECCNVWLGLFFLTGSNLADFMTPYFIGLCVDAMNDEETEKIYWYILYLFLIVVYTAIMTGFRSQWFNSMSDRVEAQIRDDLFWKFLTFDTAFFDKTATGELMSRLTSDPQAIQTVLGSNLSMLMRGTVLSIATLIIMAFINPKLFGVTCASLFPSVLCGVISRDFSKN